jgi:hypothetical protein
MWQCLQAIPSLDCHVHSTRFPQKLWPQYFNIVFQLAISGIHRLKLLCFWLKFVADGGISVSIHRIYGPTSIAFGAIRSIELLKEWLSRAQHQPLTIYLDCHDETRARCLLML